MTMSIKSIHSGVRKILSYFQVTRITSYLHTEALIGNAVQLGFSIYIYICIYIYIYIYIYLFGRVHNFGVVMNNSDSVPKWSN